MPLQLSIGPLKIDPVKLKISFIIPMKKKWRYLKFRNAQKELFVSIIFLLLRFCIFFNYRTDGLSAAEDALFAETKFKTSKSLSSPEQLKSTERYFCGATKGYEPFVVDYKKKKKKNGDEFRTGKKGFLDFTYGL